MDVVISTKEKSVYHETWCPYVSRIDKKNKKQIPEQKAIRKGYCACKFCSSVRGIVYKYKQISDMNISYDSVDNAFCVRTPVGFWKLIWRENWQEWHIFHMNHKGLMCFDPALPTKQLMRGSFHRQEDYKFATDVGHVLRYIRNHDRNYEMAEIDLKSMPKNTRAQRNHWRHHKNRKRREAVKNVYKIFKKLEKGEKV